MLWHGLTSVPCARLHKKHPPARTLWLGGRWEALDKQRSHTPGHTTSTTAKSEQARRETNHSVTGRACCLGAPYRLLPECQKKCRSKHLARVHTAHCTGAAFGYVPCEYLSGGLFSDKTRLIFLVQFRYVVLSLIISYDAIAVLATKNIVHNRTTGYESIDTAASRQTEGAIRWFHRSRA